MVPPAHARSYLASNTEGSVALYTFRVRITNQGNVPARLLERHLIILDGNGDRRDIQGEGVIGQKPHLRPGETFVYDSYCHLATVWGTLEGSYTFQDDGGDRFQVAIPRFFLTPPPEAPASATASAV
ncbi:MAG: Co2+/Mg2+ efflux protein ApaG [Planctomycetota bacterium]